ncbi:uncharacterized protein BP01DRAFT_341687 [Aspergillus saccharolyticus JOP 1030-1]|uniref:DUF7704 domain-containing protein n=1 Tax=Aspergillus saccharolyticus JOP 1030-1 TaxID=1450539 RepID=A0A318ZBZ6_9EURO|nr:hypothetical protein BP01DRAFT_341687 [Aspergillus saccharolyticus JOP 1030-1]PYH44926.1 hypothetical protein BP01DRAFT_341687 [Aspergillus saccharolyticus JOP 1030-1]
MPSILPPWPNLIFGIFEPISLIAGAVSPLINLNHFITDQIPHAQTPPPSVSAPANPLLQPQAVSLAYQLGNLYGLLALLGVGILTTSTEPQVIRNYLLALLVADVGHIYATGWGMGWERFQDIAGWNILTWGNVAVTAFLGVNRILFLLGWFGSCRRRAASGKEEGMLKKVA